MHAVNQQILYAYLSLSLYRIDTAQFELIWYFITKRCDFRAAVIASTARNSISTVTSLWNIKSHKIEIQSKNGTKTKLRKFENSNSHTYTL